MTIHTLFSFFHPLIDVLGTICLIVLAAGSVLYVIVWIFSRIWKFLVAAGVLTAIVISLGLVMGVA